ncbi:hypothetical protein BB561_006910 [Smittium simulii]|uniref:Peptidase S1 domain-containing protein n=1 Tax=Smittium simulii TaxID=133385 RepID=A0A2T9Y060_9FUNG|nr:hypothetical protein BB561_006910 [Smittium simulii]
MHNLYIFTLLASISPIYSQDNFKSNQQPLSKSGFNFNLSIPLNRINSSLRNRDLSNRVINGKVANFDDYPFAAFLYGTYENGGEACAGALIAPNVVVTAAHCFFDNKNTIFSTSKYLISVGSIQNIQNNSNRYSPSKIIVNPNYEASTGKNDVGLIILSKDVSSSIATPVKIYNKNVQDGMSATAAGWGVTSNSASASVSSTLNYVDINISSEKACSELNENWKSNDQYSICATVKDEKDTCYGDSGGPLITNISGSPLIIGVTSNGNAPGNSPRPLCAQEGGVAYYTNLNFYIDWISKESNIPVSQLVLNNDDNSITNNIPTNSSDSSTNNNNNSSNNPISKESSFADLASSQNSTNPMQPTSSTSQNSSNSSSTAKSFASLISTPSLNNYLFAITLFSILNLSYCL